MGAFEFDGEKYRQASRHQREWGSKLMAGLALNGDEAILDLGCGDGTLTGQLAALVPAGSVLGIDASAGMIEAAKKLEWGNLRFLQMDIGHMDFENRFDVIYSNAALHWVKDHRRLLKSSRAALKPGGRIRWNFGGAGTCQNFNAAVRERMGDSAYAAYFEGFEWPWFMPAAADYRELVAPVGFSKAQVVEVNADRYFSSAEEMVRWIDQPTIVPFIARIPQEEREAFRGQVIEGMLEKALQPDGTCFETFRRIQVEAVK